MSADRRLNVLIITGHDHFHHRWRDASVTLRARLEASGRFNVRVTEEFRGATPATLESYDAVLLNYYGAAAPGAQEIRWGRATEEALFTFVERGGGVVASHSSFWGGGSWRDDHADRYERMLGAVMRPTSRKVGDANGFAVTVTDPEDPITQGLPSSFVQVRDDKYVNLTRHPSADLHVLVSAHDDPGDYLAGAYWAVEGMPGPRLYDLSEVEELEGVGRDVPVCWTHHVGRGRVFALTIGHIGTATPEDSYATRDSGRIVGPTSVASVDSPEFTTLLTRGTEWAASGVVTLPYAAGYAGSTSSDRAATVRGGSRQPRPSATPARGSSARG